MRFLLCAVFAFVSFANAANALTCAEFEDLLMKSKDKDELSQRYLGGWLEGFGGSTLANAVLARRDGKNEPVCFPADDSFTVSNVDLVHAYDRAIVSRSDADKNDASKCSAEVIILLGLQQKYPCH
jgi:hypothetical protein